MNRVNIALISIYYSILTFCLDNWHATTIYNSTSIKVINEIYNPIF